MGSHHFPLSNLEAFAFHYWRLHNVHRLTDKAIQAVYENLFWLFSASQLFCPKFLYSTNYA